MIVIEILRHTPGWVFAVLIGLVVLGLRRLRASDVPVRRLLVLPVAMTAFSLFGVWQAFGTSPIAALAWTAAFVALLTVGWCLPLNARVQYSFASRRVHVPGSWLPLAMMMTIFLLRYVVAVGLAMHPAARLEPLFVVEVAALYGLSSGCFAARALNTWRSAFVAAGRAATGSPA